MKSRPFPLRPDRMRTIERPFGWIPFRVLSSGLLSRLSPPAKLLYFFLCVVADRHGLSYYGPRRIVEVLGLEPSQLVEAVSELRHEDVLAFDGQVYQLLSLPPWLDPAPGARSKRGSSESELTPARRQGPHRVGQLLDGILEKG